MNSKQELKKSKNEYCFECKHYETDLDFGDIFCNEFCNLKNIKTCGEHDACESFKSNQ